MLWNQRKCLAIGQSWFLILMAYLCTALWGWGFFFFFWMAHITKSPSHMDRTTCTIKSSVAVNAVSEISLFITFVSVKIYKSFNVYYITLREMHKLHFIFIFFFPFFSSTSNYKQPVITFHCLLPVSAIISKQSLHQDIHSVVFSQKKLCNK